MDAKHYYNPNGEELLDEGIFGGTPSGFVDFNRSKYKWDSNIYDLMNANTWFPSEVNTSSEKKSFDNLTSFIFVTISYPFFDLTFERYLDILRSLPRFVLLMNHHTHCFLSLLK